MNYDPCMLQCKYKPFRCIYTNSTGRYLDTHVHNIVTMLFIAHSLYSGKSKSLNLLVNLIYKYNPPINKNIIAISI